MRLNYYKKALLQRHKTQKLGRKRLTDFDSIKIKNPKIPSSKTIDCLEENIIKYNVHIINRRIKKS